MNRHAVDHVLTTLGSFLVNQQKVQFYYFIFHLFIYSHVVYIMQ